jgi:hypothetical protein
MDTYDWDTATDLLEEAKKIDPQDKAVLSMEYYLFTHRPKEEQKQQIQSEGMHALTAIREIMEQLPENMRIMTSKALQDPNPNTLKRLWQLYYNRHWVITHGYSNPEHEREESFSLDVWITKWQRNIALKTDMIGRWNTTSSKEKQRTKPAFVPSATKHK